MNLDGLAATVILALGFGMVRLFPILFQCPWNDVGMLMMTVTCVLVGAWCTTAYFALCIFDTSKGGARAPGALPAYPYAGGDLSPLLLMGAAALCPCPAAICWFLLGGISPYSWILALVGTFPLPMLLLACTLFGSTEAFNLRSMVRWISATRPAYLGLMARLASLLALAVALHLDSWYWRLPRVFFYAADLYLLWIAGHLLGRFYLHQKDKLGWDL
jgi:hypothetical protein